MGFRVHSRWSVSNFQRADPSCRLQFADRITVLLCCSFLAAGFAGRSSFCRDACRNVVSGDACHCSLGSPVRRWLAVSSRNGAGVFHCSFANDIGLHTSFRNQLLCQLQSFRDGIPVSGGDLALVLPKRKHDWLLLTYILLVLFFLKITAAFVLCLILVAAVMLGRWSWVQGCLTLVGFGAGLLALQIATGLPLGYLDDVVMMSAVNQGRAIYAILFTGFRNWVPLAVTGVLAATALCALHRDRSLTLARPVHAVQVFLRDERFVVDTVLLVGAAWAAESQNTGGLGLFAALAALFHPDAWKRHRLTVGVLMAALLFPVMDIAVKRSITALSREKIAAPEQLLAHALSGNTRVPMSTFEGARLLERISHEWLPLAREVQTARFFLTPDPTSNAVAAQLAWFHGVVEAARAFEENGYRTRATRFTTIAFADPFARLLQVTPATGTNLVMDRGRTVPDYSPDQLRSYLENANGVFLERCDMTNDELETLFLPILQSEFDELPLTQCWSFFARTKGN